MRVDEYLGQEQIRVTVAPQRAGYIVRPSDREGILRALSAATRRWGGITEPILPIGDDGSIGSLDRRVAETLAPDLLVAVDDDRDLDLLTSAVGRRVIPWSAFGEPGDKWPPRWCHPARIESDWSATLVTIANGPLRDCAASGTSDPGNGWSFFGRASVRQEPYLDEERAPDQAHRAQVARHTPLWATLGEVEERPRGSVFAPPVPSLIWFAEPESIDDVIAFWNARALIALTSFPNPVAVLLPPKIEPWLQFEHQLAYQLGLARFPRRCRPDAALFSYSVPIDRLRELAAHLGLLDVTAEFPYTDTYPLEQRTEDDIEAPLCATVGLDPTPWLFYPRSYGAGVDQLVQVFRQSTTIDAPWPVRFSSRGGGVVRASVSQLEHLHVPRREEVARAFKPDAFWQPGEAQPVLSFTVSISGPTMSTRLRMPTNTEVLELALRAHRARYQPSDKGKYGLALLERAAEIASVVDTPQKIAWIRQLANARTSSFTKRLLQSGVESALAEEIVDLAQLHFAVPFRPVSDLGSEAQAADLVDLFERLATAGLVYRGLAIRCETCLVHSFVELAATGARPTCPACGANAYYVVDERRKSGLSVHYRLNALLDRAVNGGVLPTLAVVRRLDQAAKERGVRMMHFVPGADLYVEDQAMGEIDILGFIDQQILAGEVKTSPQDFTQEQIDKDLQKVSAVGADVYVIASTGAIDEPQRIIAREKADAAGCRLTIIDWDSESVAGVDYGACPAEPRPD